MKIKLGNLTRLKGIAQIPLIVGLLLMAVAIPVATKLSQESAENRGQATGCSTGGCNLNQCYSGDSSKCCCSGYTCSNYQCVFQGSSSPTPRPTNTPVTTRCTRCEGDGLNKDCSMVYNTKQCEGDYLCICGGTTASCTKCSYGCNGGNCNPEPSAPPAEQKWYKVSCDSSSGDWVCNQASWGTFNSENDCRLDSGCDVPANTPVPPTEISIPGYSWRCCCANYQQGCVWDYTSVRCPSSRNNETTNISICGIRPDSICSSVGSDCCYDGTLGFFNCINNLTCDPDTKKCFDPNNQTPRSTPLPTMSLPAGFRIGGDCTSYGGGYHCLDAKISGLCSFESGNYYWVEFVDCGISGQFCNPVSGVCDTNVDQPIPCCCNIGNPGQCYWGSRPGRCGSLLGQIQTDNSKCDDINPNATGTPIATPTKISTTPTSTTKPTPPIIIESWPTTIPTQPLVSPGQACRNDADCGASTKSGCAVQCVTDYCPGNSGCGKTEGTNGALNCQLYPPFGTSWNSDYSACVGGAGPSPVVTPPPPAPTSQPQPSTCEYTSLQARVQIDISHDWRTQLTVNKGEKVNLGCMYDGTGQLAKTVRLVAKHSDMTETNFETDDNPVKEWVAPKSGNYTIFCEHMDGSRCPGLVSSSNATLSIGSACLECPNDFHCYGPSDDKAQELGYAWFATGYVQQGWVAQVPDEYCVDAGKLKPTWLGKSRGDANCDGKLDIADTSIWRKEYADISKGEKMIRNSWEADFTGPEGKCDGVVDIGDYSLWRANFTKYFQNQ